MMTLHRHLADVLTRSLCATLLVALSALLMTSCSDDALPTEPDPSDNDTTQSDTTQSDTTQKDTAAKGPYALKDIQVSLVGIYAAVRESTISSRVDHISPQPDVITIESKTDTLSNYLEQVVRWDTCIASSHRALFIRDARPDTADYKLDSCDVFQKDGRPYLRLAVKRWSSASSLSNHSDRERILMLTLGPLRDLDSLSSKEVMVFHADEIKRHASIDYSFDSYSSTSTKIGTYVTRVRTTLDSLDILPTAEIRVTLTR